MPASRKQARKARKQDLLAYEMPVTRIIEDNSLKEPLRAQRFQFPLFDVTYDFDDSQEALMARVGRRLNAEREVKVPREKLLEVLRKHLAAHNEVYKEAMEGYLKAVAEYYLTVEARAQACLGAIEAGHKKPYNIDARALIEGAPSKPVSAAEAYQEAIDTFEWDQRKNVRLTRDEFNAYVRNEWDWLKDLLVSNSHYSVSATRMLAAMER